MDTKPIAWRGSSLTDLRAFQASARREAGYQLSKVQRGVDPDDFKPIRAVGPGVFEIRIREEGRAHRVFYVAKFEEAIYVLHAFEKKSRKTPQRDVDVGRQRYRDLVRERQEAARG